MSLLSVIVVIDNTSQGVSRTLFSLSAAYQLHIAAEEYEVVIVDNASIPPLTEAIFEGLQGNFRLIRFASTPYPRARVIKQALREAKGEIIGILSDGPRLVTPGLLHFARAGAALYPRAVVATLGWDLGSDIQRAAIEAGYDPKTEEELLRSIDWQRDGYRLFDIATLDECSVDGWFSTFTESNALFLARNFWEQIGCVDEAIGPASPGPLDFNPFLRALGAEGSELVLLLGEATFRQLRGEVSTTAGPEPEAEGFDSSLEQQTRRGDGRVGIEDKRVTYLGTLPRPSLVLRVVGNVIHPIKYPLPLGEAFDQKLWAVQPVRKPTNSIAVGLTDIAHQEFQAGHYATTAAIARLTRNHFPEEPEPQRLLALVGPALANRVPLQPDPNFHAVLAQANLLLGDNEGARAGFNKALALQPDFAAAHVGLSMLNLPGPHYFLWLAKFHELLTPRFYVEIGVDVGYSMSCALPPTCAIGVDPAPRIQVPFKTEAHIFAETSNEFFSKDRLTPLLNGESVSLGFIDGEHSFEQSLLDFSNLERFCGPTSVILLHDTYPLDEVTQDRTKTTQFYTGDVWKTVHCLKVLRPDLTIFTIGTAWTGLTVVAGFDSQSHLLAERYNEIVEQFRDVSYAAVKDDLATMLNVVPNSVPEVQARLQARLKLEL
jgi:hypothetical protein